MKSVSSEKDAKFSAAETARRVKASLLGAFQKPPVKTATQKRREKKKTILK